jgi:hypothetical protein
VVSCGTAFAIVHENVWTQHAPATIVYDYDPNPELGPGFTLILDRERDDDETDINEYKTVCLHCLIDEHPELGRAIDLAKRKGSAHLVNGEWKA